MPYKSAKNRDPDAQSSPDEAQRRDPKPGDIKVRKPSGESQDDEEQDDKSDRQKSADEESDEKEQSQKKPFWKRPILLACMILAVLLLTAAGIVWWLLTRNYETTDDAFIDGHIVSVAPRVAGRVLSLNVNDNQFVSADTVVINIDPATFQASFSSADAAVQQAEANVEQAQANVAVQEANVDQAKADVLVAQANAENAKQDYDRYKSLSVEARSQEQVDTATANFKSTGAQVVSAQKREASAEAQARAAVTAIKAAQAQVAAAKAQRAQAELELDYTKVTAGHAGFVTRRTVEQGDYVTVGEELMTIVPKDVWITANFKETQLNYMRPGQPVTIKVDAYPERTYKAHVDSEQTGTGAVFSVLPPENATGNFVKIVQRVPVKIIFDEPLDRVLAPGESVEPRVDIRSGRK